MTETTESQAEQRPPAATAELAALAVNAGRALADEKRHYEIACQENARLRAVVARLRQMADHWEQQLPEVIRTPAVVSAIRAVLEAADDPSRMAVEAQQPTGAPCGCGHAADEHSVYGCADGCACEWMPKRPPMDPVHILGIACPGYETAPNRCTCDCEGCKHQCAAHQPAVGAQQPETQREWCKCPSCWGWFVEEHPGEDLDELGKDLGWWSGLPEHRDAPSVEARQADTAGEQQ